MFLSKIVTTWCTTCNYMVHDVLSQKMIV